MERQATNPSLHGIHMRRLVAGPPRVLIDSLHRLQDEILAMVKRRSSTPPLSEASECEHIYPTPADLDDALPLLRDRPQPHGVSRRAEEQDCYLGTIA